MQEFTVQLFDDGSAQISGTGANLELRFGYSKNAHIYSVKFIRSKEWEDLYIRVHFHPEADIYDVEPVLAQNNIVNIPAMITSMPGEGKLTIEGTDGYKIITSADIPYRVSENSGIDSDTDPEPGESSFQQFVDEVKKDAEEAKQAAKDAESALTETKEASASALADIEKAKGNAISEIEKIETEVKGEIQEDVDSAKSSAEASSKSAEEAKTAADSAKKSLSDLETAKQSAISEISKEKDNSVSAIGSAKEAALNEISTSGNSAIQNVKMAETNAINSVETEGSTQKTALNNASNAALTSIDTAKTNAVKAVEDKASEESSAIDQKSNEVIQDIQNAGDSKLSAISEATSSAIEQITQSAGQHLTQIDSAADEAVTDIMNAKEDSLEEIEGVNAHPPIQNPETGKWQIWNAETSSYVDTVYDWEGGYYSPSVDSEGNLTWEGSKEGMGDIPSTNIRGPQGLGVPTSTANDYGKAPTVNASGTGYELIGPYAPISAAITETAKGNPAVCEDSVEWGLQGVRVYGKSTQVTTTGAQLFDVSKITSDKIISNDGSLYAYGANWCVSDYIEIEPSASYSTSENLYYGDETAETSHCFFDEEKALISAIKSNVNSFNSPANAKYIRLTINVRKYPELHFMFNAGSTVKPWEPYTGGQASPSPEYPQEIVSAGDGGSIAMTVSDGADQSQSLTISTPNGLPGIPVDSGGNYTDADGQQWVCDEIDFARGVYVQRIQITILDSLNFKVLSNDNNRFFANYALANKIIENSKSLASFSIFATNATKNYSFTPYNNYLYFRMNDGDVEQINALFENVFPAVLVTQLATPIETPLSEEELAAYRVLHTYDSTTVITPDDALAEVEVDYLVKSKAYIEKKLTAIESRLNALEISEALEGE